MESFTEISILTRPSKLRKSGFIYQAIKSKNSTFQSFFSIVMLLAVTVLIIKKKNRT